MAEKHADQGYRKLGKTLKEMTWKQRWDHLIYYYGVIGVATIALLLMGVFVVADMLSEKPVVKLEGMTVNVRWEDSVEKALTEDLYERFNVTDPNMQVVTVTHAVLDEYSNQIIDAMTTRIYTGEIDYLVVNKMAMDWLAPWGAFTDLQLLLSEETLKKWELCFVYAQGETGDKYPIAIDLAKTPFAEKCTFKGDHLYLGFPGNTKREMTPEDILAYFEAKFLTGND